MTLAIAVLISSLITSVAGMLVGLYRLAAAVTRLEATAEKIEKLEDKHEAHNAAIAALQLQIVSLVAEHKAQAARLDRLERRDDTGKHRANGGE